METSRYKENAGWIKSDSELASKRTTGKVRKPRRLGVKVLAEPVMGKPKSFAFLNRT